MYIVQHWFIDLQLIKGLDDKIRSSCDELIWIRFSSDTPVRAKLVVVRFSYFWIFTVTFNADLKTLYNIHHSKPLYQNRMTYNISKLLPGIISFCVTVFVFVHSCYVTGITKSLEENSNDVSVLKNVSSIQDVLTSSWVQSLKKRKEESGSENNFQLKFFAKQVKHLIMYTLKFILPNN